VISAGCGASRADCDGGSCRVGSRVRRHGAATRCRCTLIAKSDDVLKWVGDGFADLLGELEVLGFFIGEHSRGPAQRSGQCCAAVQRPSTPPPAPTSPKKRSAQPLFVANTERNGEGYHMSRGRLDASVSSMVQFRTRQVPTSTCCCGVARTVIVTGILRASAHKSLLINLTGTACLHIYDENDRGSSTTYYILT
jgi:hypothetical protein